MNVYRLYGLLVKTDIDFPQLVSKDKAMELQAAENLQEIEIVAGDIPEHIVNRTDVKYEFGEKLSWLSNRTCYIVVEGGMKITYKLKEDGNFQYLQTYLLGWGMSMLALQRGMLAMHCSAVADGEGAVLICGESGAGKSTVTTALLEEGYRLMADDMAFVEAAPGNTSIAYPAFPWQKLCRNVAVEKGYCLEDLIYINEEKDKFLVPYQGAFYVDGIPVKQFIMLGVVNGDAVLEQAVEGFEKFRVVANNLFLRNLLGEDKYRPDIGQMCLNVAAGVKINYIGRPIGKDTADEVVNKVKKILSEGKKNT